MLWCPYTDRMLAENDMNSEHIIPLSLGGSNAFCIPVEKHFNATAGSKIDGVLANDFFISILRREFNARGHSNTPPKVILKRALLSADKTPVQVTLRGKEYPLVWDARSKRNLNIEEFAGKTVSSKISIGYLNRLRFIAKTALSAGYFTYSNLFKNYVAHDELRIIMNLDDSVDANILKSLRIRAYDQFSPIAEADVKQIELEKFFCQFVNGSCVILIPGQNYIGFVVGILGTWIGTMNVPASTSIFDMSGDFDLGHVVIIQNGKTNRISYRQLAKDVKASFKN